MLSVHETVEKTRHPLKILQYGEGNFLRAFFDYMLDIANEKGVFDGAACIVKAIPFGSLADFAEQKSIYTVVLRDAQHSEQRIIRCVDRALCAYDDYDAYAALAENPDLRFIVSNTTEAGIVYDENDRFELRPPTSFPGKLTKFLYERYTAFDGAVDKGLIILPVELIDKNGFMLKECCRKLAALWGLPPTFIAWLTDSNIFCNTLVDRIVTGYPKDEIGQLERELGYHDKLLVTGECHALWVIECGAGQQAMLERELPFTAAGLPVIITDDLAPYRERKVRLLNGTHTATVFVALLAGLETVGEALADQQIRRFMEQVLFNELAPFVPLPAEEVRAYATAVLERFGNPHIRHEWRSIALNSVSKVKARLLPTVLETYNKNGCYPKLLCLSLAALLEYYRIHGAGGDPDAPEGMFAELLGMADLSGLAAEVENNRRYLSERGIRSVLEQYLC